MKIEDWDFHTRCGILWRFKRTPYGVSSIISSLFEKKLSFFRVVISRYLIKIEDWDFHTRCGISCRWTMPGTIFSVNLTVTEIFEDEKNLWNSVFLKYLSNGTIFWHQFFYGAAQGNSGFDMHWLDMIIFIRIWDIYTKAKILDLKKKKKKKKKKQKGWRHWKEKSNPYNMYQFWDRSHIT